MTTTTRRAPEEVDQEFAMLVDGDRAVCAGRRAFDDDGGQTRWSDPTTGGLAFRPDPGLPVAG